MSLAKMLKAAAKEAAQAPEERLLPAAEPPLPADDEVRAAAAAPRRSRRHQRHRVARDTWPATTFDPTCVNLTCATFGLSTCDLTCDLTRDLTRNIDNVRQCFRYIPRTSQPIQRTRQPLPWAKVTQGVLLGPTQIAEVLRPAFLLRAPS